MQTLTIGQLAKRAGVGVETVRFYERKGLLQEPERRASGYREYEESAVDRLRFIRRAKERGFTLDEIHELLSLRVDPKTTCADVKHRTQAKITEINGKMESLQRMKTALEKLAHECQGRGKTSECPILDALDGDEDVRQDVR